MNWIIAVPFLALWANASLLALIVRVAPGTKAGRIYRLYLGVLALWAFSSWMIHLDVFPGPNFWIKVITSLAVVTQPLIVHFATEFPRTKLRWVNWIWYPFALGIVIIVWLGLFPASATMLPGGQGAVQVEFGPLVPLIAVYWLASAGAVIGVFAYSLRIATTRAERLWIIYPMVGNVLILAGTLTNAIPALGPYPVDILANLVNAVLTAYAILRHRFLDVVVKKGVLHSLLTAVISLTFLLIVFLFDQVFRGLTGYSELASAAVVALLVSVVYQPLREVLQGWIDRLFQRGGRDYRKVLREFSQSMTAVLNVDELADTTVEVISKALLVPKVALLLLDEAQEEFRVRAARGIPASGLAGVGIPRRSRLGSWLSGEYVLLGAVELQSPDELRRILLAEVEDLGLLQPEILVPIRTRSLLLGILLLGPKLSDEPYLDDDRGLLSTFANQAAIAVENARLYEGTRERLEQLGSLHKVSLAIASRLDLEEVLQFVSEQAKQLVKAERAALFSLDEPNGELKVAASKGPHGGPEETIPLSPRGFIVSHVATTQQALLLQAGSGDLSFDEERKAKAIKDAIAVPLKVENRVVGVLEVTNKMGEGTFTDNDLQMLSLLANHAAIAINDARLYQDLQARMEELEQTQAQLLQSVKLATVGEMAASVAHEINNPLGGILGFTELLLDDTEDNDPRKNDLNAIKAETIRARNIIRNWLGFARQSDEQLEAVGLNEVVRGTVDLLRRQSELMGVTLREMYGANLPTVEVHANQMKQVFLNILNNALFAMPEGGTLAIRTWKDESVVAVDIEDTGVGITSENLARIFDPFFSTKPEPKGTGLGLSISQSIVLRHGGAIDVASEVGRGTIFTIKLPTPNGRS